MVVFMVWFPVSEVTTGIVIDTGHNDCVSPWPTNRSDGGIADTPGSTWQAGAADIAANAKV
jgi:hypothetical protein